MYIPLMIFLGTFAGTTLLCGLCWLMWLAYQMAVKKRTWYMVVMGV
jgi:hypothetical protein